MSDTHILIGKRLRHGAEQCGTGTYKVDLSDFTLNEIRDRIVAAMLNEFRQLYTFELDEATRAVEVKWHPSLAKQAQQRQPDRLTSQLKRRRC